MATIPKGDYPPRDAAWLDAPSVLSYLCIFCGATATNNHHHPPRGRFHKHDEHRVPRLSVCGMGNASGCHGLLHHNGGTLTPRVPTDSRYCDAIADEKAAADINRRRKRNGLRPIRAGVPFMAKAEHPDSEHDEFEAACETASANIRTLRMSGAEAWRLEAENVAMVYAADTRDGTRFTEWRESEGISRGESSKMLTVAAFLEKPELRERPWGVQYEAARAIRRERGERSDIIADAEVLSLTDFRAKWWPAKGQPEKELCPTCHLLVDPKRLHQEGDA